MVRGRQPSGLFVVVVLIGLAVAPTLAAAPAAAATGSANGVESTQVQQPTVACDYAALYNDTIESVVLVQRQRGQGSGFVYDAFENGTSHVVTNQHVVGSAEQVTVTFRRGQVRSGTVVGADPYADLAVVRIDDTPAYVSDLSVAAAVPIPGRSVAALGAPFGLRGTITHGIVSGVNRSMPTDQGFTIPDVVQTDAPINPGNSGGPLVTCNGTVVGVNTAGLQASAAENVGFAVSAALLDRVVPALIATGEYDWPYLGVRTAAVTPAIAAANDLDTARGVAVVRTVEGGPAAGALQGASGSATVDGRTVPVGGDVIVAVEGHPVTSGEDLSSFLATSASPGQTITLTVVRSGERRTVRVTLGERPTPPTGVRS